MRDLLTIRAEINALEAEYAEAKKTADAEYNEAAKAFVMEYDWSITWPHQSQFRVERKATADCLNKLEAFKTKYGRAPQPFEGGMTYSVLIGGFVESGGGSVILKWPQQQSFGPSPFKPSWLSQIRRGIIPDELKAK